MLCLFIQKLLLDILWLQMILHSSLRYFLQILCQKHDILQNNLNLPCSNLIFAPHRICVFLHLKRLLCAQDVEHGLLKSLKLNLLMHIPRENEFGQENWLIFLVSNTEKFDIHVGHTCIIIERFHFMINNNPTAVSCALFNGSLFYKSVPLPCYQPSYVSCTNFTTFMLTSPWILSLKINVKNRKVCDETRSPLLLLRWFAGFTLHISYCA